MAKHCLNNVLRVHRGNFFEHVQFVELTEVVEKSKVITAQLLHQRKLSTFDLLKDCVSIIILESLSDVFAIFSEEKCCGT